MGVDVLYFDIRHRRCALPTSAVLTVGSAPNLTPVPLSPQSVRGIVPYAGQVLPLIDLGVFFTSTTAPLDTSLLDTGAAKIVFFEATIGPDAVPMRAALAVDRVHRLGHVRDDQKRPPPAEPDFLIATILDASGLAWLIDASRALARVQATFPATVGGPVKRSPSLLI